VTIPVTLTVFPNISGTKSPSLSALAFAIEITEPSTVSVTGINGLPTSGSEMN